MRKTLLDITPDEIEREWQNFKRKFRTNQTLKVMKDYDEVKRRAIFVDNYRAIRKHNMEADNGKHTYWLGYLYLPPPCSQKFALADTLLPQVRTVYYSCSIQYKLYLQNSNMNYKLLLVTIVTMVNADDGPWVDCPDNYPISAPCSYIPPQLAGEWCYIECKNNANITKILGDLSAKLPADKKKFISIALDYLTEEDLPAQAFAGIQFELISIFGRNVKRIHKQAFAGTGVQKMQFIHAESLTEVVSGADHEWDLFGAIRSQP
ncbi:unnamed protein product, partial [Medioppia subpectinata]